MLLQRFADLLIMPFSAVRNEEKTIHDDLVIEKNNPSTTFSLCTGYAGCIPRKKKYSTSCNCTFTSAVSASELESPFFVKELTSLF